jgi:hypothetical protein
VHVHRRCVGCARAAEGREAQFAPAPNCCGNVTAAIGERRATTKLAAAPGRTKETGQSCRPEARLANPAPAAVDALARKFRPE